MFTPKDEGIASWFNYLFINIFWIFPINFGPLDVGIAIWNWGMHLEFDIG
jgi:hypothetical protein